ncbi:MerR family transcriptional regulator [Salinispora tropica]|uniref:Transcriptional regulator, MerR family n=1 Tax=Salinispora tropica (strain ATCC BAA-916 / DSM 44818 / JCM 13857 / NBRC 105044 / CNB-440) TaxID=369723 RepID=A4X3T3_SALTO|nr:MerR family transcriptional regulator [Salinispora tropica]ABP53533.1 transcriptional regulator, MerR family [Salinispora tropica CNB-440]
MRIGELSARTGASRRALRYYEEQGLLVPQREANGYREYGDDAPLVVDQITALLASGLNSDAIRRFLPCAQGPRPELQMCPDLRAHLQQRRDELNRQQRQLALQVDNLTAHLE